MNSYAIANKKSIEEDEDYPTCSMCITREEWETLSFKYMVLDSEDDLPFLETDHPNGYNMILLHPVSKELFWGYTFAFEFIHKE